MKIRTIALALMAALPAGAALAHEGHIHKVMGTVAAFHPDTKTLEVKTEAGKVETVTVSDATKYLRGAGSAATVATPADVKKGVRVVVSTKEENGTRTATEVRLGAKATPAAGSVPRGSAVTVPALSLGEAPGSSRIAGSSSPVKAPL